MPGISVHVNKSVQSAIVAIAGVSAGYLLWKWLDDDEGTLRKIRRNKKQIPGLANVGNSCFMNVLLQAFASCPIFCSWLKDFLNETNSDKDHVYLAEVVLKILKVLTGEEEINDYFFDPSDLLQDMNGRGWQISSQEQDSHEFYHAVMTTLIEEYRHHVEKRIRTLGLFEVDELLSSPNQRLHVPKEGKEEEESEQQFSLKRSYPPFRGTLANVLQCQTCGYKHPVRYDGFVSLSLPLPSSLSWMAQINVVDCLRNFMGPELVNNVECVNCGRLQFADNEVRLLNENSHQDSRSKVSDAITNAVKGLSNPTASTNHESDRLSSSGTGTVSLSDVTTDITGKKDDVTSNFHTSVEQIQLEVKGDRRDGESECKTNSKFTNASDVISEITGQSEPSCSTSSISDTTKLTGHADVMNANSVTPVKSTQLNEPKCTVNACDAASDAAEPNVASTTVNNVDSLDQTDINQTVAQDDNNNANEAEQKSDNQSIRENLSTAKHGRLRLKAPFPALTMTTQRRSFDRFFQRRLKTAPEFKKSEVVYPPVRRTFQRHLSFGKLPDCLCMHIQRLVWVQGTPVKKTNFVPFPEILDVGPFTDISRIQGKSYKNRDAFAESIRSVESLQMQKALIMSRAAQNGSNPGTSLPLSLQKSSETNNQMEEIKQSQSKGTLYKLMSVVVHVGDWSFSGHFLAYRRALEPVGQTGNSEWVFTSDTLVRKATRDEVFSCPAYMLFYERIKS